MNLKSQFCLYLKTEGVLTYYRLRDYFDQQSVRL